jgi:bacteriocin-like protein
MEMNHELSINELDAVSGGRLNLADLPGYHPTYRSPTHNPGAPGSPLYGNSSYKDTIDNVDGLP